jgi:peroxiredoxin/predicted DsbA family dithiol-disulfide isomerase
MQSQRPSVVFPACTFALMGACLSGLLLIQHAHAARGACGEAGCAAVFASRWATFPPATTTNVSAAPTGLPVALYGLLYFVGLGVWLAVTGRLSWSQRLWHSVPMAVASLGAVTSLGLIAGMTSLAAWCPLCWAVHLTNLLLVLYVYWCRPEPEDIESPQPAIAPRPAWAGAVCAVFAMAATGYAWQRYERQLERDATSTAAAWAAETGQRPPTEASTDVWLIDSDFADADTVVIYTDLLSPACQSFQRQLLEQWVPQFEGHVRVALRHAPQCAACNPEAADLHPTACASAYLAEAARIQGGGEAFQRVLLTVAAPRTQPWSEEEAISLALDLGLQPEQFVSDWQNAAVQERVAADIAAARQHGISELPAVFVNGQPIPLAISNLPDYWQQLAARPRSDERLVATVNSTPHQTAKPVLPPAAATNTIAAASDEPPRGSTVFAGDALDIAGPTLAGTEFDLRQQRGRPALVVFWTSTAAGTAELTAELLRLHRNYGELGLAIVGVNGDRDPEAAREFVDRNQLPWPQIHFVESAASGRANPLSRRYHLTADPALLVVNAEGLVTALPRQIRDVEPAVAATLGLRPTPEWLADVIRTELAATLIRPKPTASTNKHAVQLGDTVDITGPTLAGEPFDLSQQLAPATVVAFWASTCSASQAELPQLRALRERYREHGLALVGISTDRSRHDLDEFLSHNALPWPTIYFDSDGLRGFNNPVAQWHGVQMTPTFFLLDAEHRAVAVATRGEELEPVLAKLLQLTLAAPPTQSEPSETPPPPDLPTEAAGVVAPQEDEVSAGPRAVPAAIADSPAEASPSGLDPMPTESGVVSLQNPGSSEAAELPKSEPPLEPIPQPAMATPVEPPPAPAAPSETDPPPSKHSLDRVPAPLLVHTILRRFDANADGVLQRSEYQRIPGDFAQYDANRDDRLSPEELADAVAVLQRMKSVWFPTRNVVGNPSGKLAVAIERAAP